MKIKKRELYLIIENFLSEKKVAKKLKVTGKFQILINKMLKKKKSNLRQLKVDNQWGKGTDKAFREVLRLYAPPEFAGKTWAQIAKEQNIPAKPKSALQYLETLFDDTMSGSRKKAGGSKEEKVEPYKEKKEKSVDGESKKVIEEPLPDDIEKELDNPKPEPQQKKYKDSPGNAKAREKINSMINQGMFNHFKDASVPKGIFGGIFAKEEEKKSAENQREIYRKISVRKISDVVEKGLKVFLE